MVSTKGPNDSSYLANFTAQQAAGPSLESVKRTLDQARGNSQASQDAAHADEDFFSGHSQKAQNDRAMAVKGGAATSVAGTIETENPYMGTAHTDTNNAQFSAEILAMDESAYGAAMDDVDAAYYGTPDQMGYNEAYDVLDANHVLTISRDFNVGGSEPATFDFAVYGDDKNGYYYIGPDGARNALSKEEVDAARKDNPEGKTVTEIGNPADVNQAAQIMSQSAGQQLQGLQKANAAAPAPRPVTQEEREAKLDKFVNSITPGATVNAADLKEMAYKLGVPLDVLENKLQAENPTVKIHNSLLPSDAPLMGFLGAGLGLTAMNSTVGLAGSMGNFIPTIFSGMPVSPQGIASPTFNPNNIISDFSMTSFGKDISFDGDTAGPTMSMKNTFNTVGNAMTAMLQPQAPGLASPGVTSPGLNTYNDPLLNSILAGPKPPASI